MRALFLALTFLACIAMPASAQTVFMDKDGMRIEHSAPPVLFPPILGQIAVEQAAQRQLLAKLRTQALAGDQQTQAEVQALRARLDALLLDQAVLEGVLESLAAVEMSAERLTANYGSAKDETEALRRDVDLFKGSLTTLVTGLRQEVAEDVAEATINREAILAAIAALEREAEQAVSSSFDRDMLLYLALADLQEAMAKQHDDLRAEMALQIGSVQPTQVEPTVSIDLVPIEERLEQIETALTDGFGDIPVPTDLKPVRDQLDDLDKKFDELSEILDAPFYTELPGWDRWWQWVYFVGAVAVPVLFLVLVFLALMILRHVNKPVLFAGRRVVWKRQPHLKFLGRGYVAHYVVEVDDQQYDAEFRRMHKEEERKHGKGQWCWAEFEPNGRNRMACSVSKRSEIRDFILEAIKDGRLQPVEQ